MIWNSECNRVKNLLALEMGRDLGEPDRVAMRRHVEQCSHCRTHWERAQAAHRVLEQVRASTVVGGSSSFRSVWPELKAQLLARQVLSQPQTMGGRAGDDTRHDTAQAFNGWLPIGALAAACIAILVVADSGPRADRPHDFSGQMPTGQFQHRLQPAMHLVPRPTNGTSGAPGTGSPPSIFLPTDRNGLKFIAEPSRMGPAESDSDSDPSRPGN